MSTIHNCTSFFHDKLTKIKLAIISKLNGGFPDPLQDDKLFISEKMWIMPCVTEEEVQKILSLMLNKSSSHDLIPNHEVQ